MSSIYQARPLPDGRAEVVAVVGTFDATDSAELVAELANLERNPERRLCETETMLRLLSVAGGSDGKD